MNQCGLHESRTLPGACESAITKGVVEDLEGKEEDVVKNHQSVRDDALPHQKKARGVRNKKKARLEKQNQPSWRINRAKKDFAS